MRLRVRLSVFTLPLLTLLRGLPPQAISKINEIARRCRLVQAHVHLLYPYAYP